MAEQNYLGIANDYNNAGNWDKAGIPVTNDNARMADSSQALSVGLDQTGVAATGTLTLSANAGDTETVVIDTKTYTFQTILTDVDGNVLIGATASDSIDNLVAAINLGAGGGTKYAASMTLHPTVTGSAGAGDTLVGTAKTKGVAGNTIVTTETLTSGSWGGGTLSGGIDPVVLAGLFSAETMTGNLGGTGNPLKIDATTVTCRSGAQEFWIKGTYPEFIAAPKLLTPNACVIDTITPELLTNLFVQRGRVTIVDSSLVTTGYVLGEAGDAILVIQANTVFSGDLHIDAGRVLLSGEVDGVIYLSGGGILEMLEGCDVNKLLMTGGTCEFKDGSFTGATDSVVIKSGHFNGSAHGKQTTIPDFKILSNNASVNLRTGVNAIDITTYKQIGSAKVVLDDGKTY